MICPECGGPMDVDTVLVGVWIDPHPLRSGERRGYERTRLTTAGLCTRCECCIELRDFNANKPTFRG